MGSAGPEGCERGTIWELEEGLSSASERRSNGALDIDAGEAPERSEAAAGA